LLNRDYAGRKAPPSRVSAQPAIHGGRAGLGPALSATGRADDAKKVYANSCQKGWRRHGAAGLADIEMADKKWSERDYINAPHRRAERSGAWDQAGHLYELRQDWNNARSVAGELVAKIFRRM